MRLHVNAVGAIIGGAARHLPPFLDALVTERPSWSVHVWISAGADPSAFPPGVSHVAVPRRGYAHRVLWESVQLPREMRRRGADALLNLTNSAPVVPLVPSVMYQRNPYYWDPSWVRTLDPRMRFEAFLRRQLAFVQARTSRTVVTPSHAMADYLRAWRGWPRSADLRVVPHAVDTSRFSFREREWPPPQDRPVRLLWVSHAAPHKDQELLPTILDELRRRGRDAELWLTTGSNEPQAVRCYEAVRMIVDALGLGPHVRFLGRTADPERLYADADFLVFPSKTESFGFPIVEAMASGLPVVATAIGSSVELLGDIGRTFPVGDAEAAADAIEAFLREDRRHIAPRLREGAEVARGFTWQANAAAVADLLDAARHR